MARAFRIVYPGASYHVASGGNERKNICLNKKGRERFLSCLESATVRYGALVRVYCLVSNHCRLSVETPRGNLSQIVKGVNGAFHSLVPSSLYGSLFTLSIHSLPIRFFSASRCVAPSLRSVPWKKYAKRNAIEPPGAVLCRAAKINWS
jgi:hypothetical protein